MNSRYTIGQRVWRAVWRTNQERVPCPDCNETRVWRAISATGEEFTIKCPRCEGYRLDKMPTLTRTRVHAEIVASTIGSVRTDSAAKPGEQVSYMCVETGVGSGSVFYEPQLYPNAEEAQVAANIFTSEKQAMIDTEPRALLAAEFAAMPIRVALAETWRADGYHAWDEARDYREAMQQVIDAVGMHIEEAQDLLSEALAPRPWRRPHPVTKLIAAAQALLGAVEEPGAEGITNAHFGALSDALKELP